MGYGGYLVKFGNYTIPNNLIKQDTFSSYVNMQDKDPWTDENGYEHRDAVELKALLDVSCEDFKKKEDK